MSNIKTLGLILAFICFVVLEVAFISAAITVAGVLLWLAGVGFGLYEINPTGDIHWWFVLSTVWMLLNGITYQFKESYKLVNEHKNPWSQLLKSRKLKLNLLSQLKTKLTLIQMYHSEVQKIK